MAVSVSAFTFQYKADLTVDKSSNFEAKPAKLRATCEGCRKLKVKCLPSDDGSVCKKCQRKGVSYVRQPRAGYGTRVKKL